jgi:hypothetical protein
MLNKLSFYAYVVALFLPFYRIMYHKINFSLSIIKLLSVFVCVLACLGQFTGQQQDGQFK